MPLQDRQHIAVVTMEADDWPAVRVVYLEGIATGNSTFERSAPEWETWDRSHLRVCRLVARSQGELLGWAALSPASSRCVYAGVAEVSVYVAARARGKGIGRALLSELILASEHEGVWTLQAGIFPENTASIELCKKVGFRVVGIRERLGCMEECWRDVVLMERRSTAVGI